MLFGQTFRRPHTSIMKHVYLMHKQLLIKENSHLVTTHFNNNPPIESINMGSVFAITHIPKVLNHGTQVERSLFPWVLVL